MSKIVMLLSNAFRPDPRVAREAESLVRGGHQVTVVCWDRQSRFALHEAVNGYHVERIQTVLTRYGAGARQIFHTPRYWRLVQRFQLGEVVDPESPEAIAQALQTVLNKPHVRASMRRGAAAAREVYNWENESQKLVQSYRKFVCE
jgi:glycosyltransferase involved in cell wall biosynthesis